MDLDLKDLRRFRQELLGDMRPAEIVWHYTGLEGFNGILTSGAIWMSDPKDLNDRKEIRYGQELEKRVLEAFTADADTETREMLDAYKEHRRCSRVERTFVASFSNKGDEQVLWRYGAKGSGVSLGFGSAALEAAANATAAKETIRPIPALYAVRYCPTVQRNKLLAVFSKGAEKYRLLRQKYGKGSCCDEWVCAFLTAHLDALYAFMKEPSQWELESENRLALFCEDCGSLEVKTSTTANNVPRSYVEWNILNGASPDLALRTVRAGRAADPEAVREILRKTGYPEVEVVPSAIR